MKFKLIALAVAFASFAAYGADGTPGNGQSSESFLYGQTQTATSSDPTKQPAAKAEAAKGQQTDDHWESSWKMLDQGWKQFDHQQQTGK